MKVRTDFVTNSSSSSFVIAYKKNEYDEETLKKYPEIQMLEVLIHCLFDSESNETSAATFIDNAESLTKFFKEVYYDEFSEDDELMREYNDALKYISNGYVVVFKSVGYDDEGLREALNSLSGNMEKGFVIISSD